MTLSVCSMCKNATDGICLLGQSYIDIYASVQAIAEGQHREALALQLAPCSFWEESELLKQISREVTLTQQAWRRIAYIKLQKADQEMFASLIDAARSVLHNPSEQPALSGTSMPAAIDGEAETINNRNGAISEVTPPESTPPEAAALETMPSEAATSETATPEPTPSEPEAHYGENSAAAAPVENSEDSDSDLTFAVDELPEPDGVVADPMPKEHQPQATVANDKADPIEQAMQELWVVALASNGAPVPPTLSWGRGSGRITETDVLSSNFRADRPQSLQSQTLPGIA